MLIKWWFILFFFCFLYLSFITKGSSCYKTSPCGLVTSPKPSGNLWLVATACHGTVIGGASDPSRQEDSDRGSLGYLSFLLSYHHPSEGLTLAWSFPATVSPWCCQPFPEKEWFPEKIEPIEKCRGAGSEPFGGHSGVTLQEPVWRSG